MGLFDKFKGNKFNTELEKARNTKGAVLLDVRTKRGIQSGTYTRQRKHSVGQAV